jgi:putative transposase
MSPRPNYSGSDKSIQRHLNRAGVRWYVAYPLSTRHVEELMLERGVHVNHSTINRWVVTYSPQLEEAFHRRKRTVWVSWRMDETYIKVNTADSFD